MGGHGFQLRGGWGIGVVGLPNITCWTLFFIILGYGETIESSLMIDGAYLDSVPSLSSFDSLHPLMHPHSLFLSYTPWRKCNCLLTPSFSIMGKNIMNE